MTNEANQTLEQLAADFIESHGEQYQAATDQWILVRVFCFGRGFPSDETANDVDDLVWDRLNLPQVHLKDEVA